MPRGPKGEKRPVDAVGAAVMVAKIATRQIEDKTPEEPPKNVAAAELGRMGGQARAKSLSRKRRAAIAKKAAKSRWANRRSS